MVHLTEKPVELAVRAMQYSSRPGENVLDLFGGSGSTLIAAEQTGPQGVPDGARPAVLRRDLRPLPALHRQAGRARAHGRKPDPDEAARGEYAVSDARHFKNWDMSEFSKCDYGDRTGTFLRSGVGTPQLGFVPARRTCTVLRPVAIGDQLCPPTKKRPDVANVGRCGQPKPTSWRRTCRFSAFLKRESFPLVLISRVIAL